MSKYKVGDTFFVAPSGRFFKKEGYATVKKVGRKYAEMDSGIIYCNKSQAGVLYKTKEEYDLKIKKEKISEKISRDISGFCGYKKLIGVSMDDLLKIAEMLDIELDE